MIDLPPINDDEDLPVIAPTKKYKVPFKLKENMLCYNCNEDSYDRRDLIGWLDVVEEHYDSTEHDRFPSDAYTVLLHTLSVTFPGLDFDAVTCYCDYENVCSRSKLIEAWRAFLSNMGWDECDEPKLDNSRRQQKRKN